MSLFLIILQSSKRAVLCHFITKSWWGERSSLRSSPPSSFTIAPRNGNPLTTSHSGSLPPLSNISSVSHNTSLPPHPYSLCHFAPAVQMEWWISGPIGYPTFCSAPFQLRAVSRNDDLFGVERS
ncbi:hypothetical protein AVEN_193496-1 [Araneus ventricosus]|uniref:Uncharacterized protein n=1 Tax=Araneus ventricosus TaxID=182803 RepID=A0A4Y2KNA5_ARAVE|nr:hypothetical protein AVEN_193496-1 [Araneus ventricosus]